MSAAARWNASGKHDDLDAALRVLEREDRHPIALARLELAAGGDDAADAGVGLDRLAAAGPPAVVARRRDGEVASSPTVFAPNSFERGGVAIDRVAAPVQAERFLLEGELLGLGPRRRVGQRHRRRSGAVASAVRRIVERAEQLRLPFVRDRAAAARRARTRASIAASSRGRSASDGSGLRTACPWRANRTRRP